MKTKVSRWGASCAVRLPKMVVETLELFEGQSVEMKIIDNKLIIEKSQREFKLQDLIDQMNPKNKPLEALKDDPKGGEVI